MVYFLAGHLWTSMQLCNFEPLYISMHFYIYRYNYIELGTTNDSLLALRGRTGLYPRQVKCDFSPDYDFSPTSSIFFSIY